MRRALLLIGLLHLALAAPAAAAPDTWTRWVVPSDLNVSATVRSLDFTAPGVVYGGTEDNGVYVSTNSGLSWDQDNAGLDGITGANNIRQVVSNGGSLFVATSVGVFSKQVGGGSWAPLGQGAEAGRLNLPVQYLHFNSGSDILAGVAAASPGIYRSTDSGEHWTRAAGIPTGTSVYFIHSATGILFAAADTGVYRSLDGGASWSLRADGLPFANAYRMAGDLGNLFVATTSGIYRSDNGGETWTDRNGFGATALGNTETLGMVAAPTGFGGGRLLVATGKGVWATRSNGLYWGKMASTSVPADPSFGNLKSWTLGFNPIALPGRLLAGTQGWGAYALPFQAVSNTGAPTHGAGGTLRVGNSITGSAGSWGGTAPYFFGYMWVRCTNNTNTSSCTENTGDTGLTHVVEQADNGKYLRLRVSAFGIVPPDPGNAFSAPTPIVQPAQGVAPTPPAPQSGFPKITGPDGEKATQKSYDWGTELTAQPGTWSNPSTTFTYQWLRCSPGCAEIPGATTNTFTPVPDDAEKTLSVEITGTANNNSTTSTVGPTFQITERKPQNVQPPRVLGDPYVGKTLDSTAGAWEGRKLKFFRTWQVCEADGTGCNAIINETGQQYTINKIWLGKRLRVRIQADNAPGQQDDREAFSDLTPVITERPVDAPPGGGEVPGGTPPPPGGTPPGGTPPGTVPPGLPGGSKPTLVLPRRLRVGATLKAPAIPGATKVRYQWLRNGKKIKKARKRGYRIKRKDRGKRIACRISFVIGGQTVRVTTKAVKIPRKRR